MKTKKITGCHNCPYNGKHNNACLSCNVIQEEYSYRYQHYILPTYDAPMPEQQESIQATNLPEEEEDNMKKMLYQIFDLDFVELLLLKCIQNNLSLTEFADKFNRFIKYHNKKKDNMTRFCAFQTRKRMLKKLSGLALLTKGQKKQLK